jgi:hypothetical protein
MKEYEEHEGIQPVCYNGRVLGYHWIVQPACCNDSVSGTHWIGGLPSQSVRIAKRKLCAQTGISDQLKTAVMACDPA